MGLQEHSQGEACWWTVHPASKQRSEGEKVRVGDDLILVSVATERYLVMEKRMDDKLLLIIFEKKNPTIAFTYFHSLCSIQQKKMINRL